MISPTLKYPLTSLRHLWLNHKVFRYAVYMVSLPASLILLFVLAVHFLPFNEAQLRNLPVSTVVHDRNGAFLRAYLSQDDRWRIPATLSKVSPWAVKATVVAEDKRFYSHHGIDWIAVSRAILSNIKAGRIVSGASTISMQVAGFMVDSRERSLVRKLRQAFLALQLETRWTKQDILESYFTHASYGGNVCGIEAAARRYFNKTAAELSVGESALLAGIPQSPEKFRPDRSLPAALRRREYILERLSFHKHISPADYKRVSKMKVTVGTYEVPIQAPHFCDVVHALYPSNKSIKSTLDSTMQRRAEEGLRATVNAHRSGGATNGAIIILENQTAEVRVYVGSADYWNRFDRGQVNAPMGFRSPGSTLKPLFYGQALDLGLLEPDEMLYDVPVTIAGYSPVNYDRNFRGPISASKALAWSLNIPAIEVLRRVGVPEFRDTLHAVGVPLKVNPLGDPGLSLAIGTCSVRLLDLTAAYASLANGGVVLPPVWHTTGFAQSLSPSSSPQRWLSAPSARAVLSMLSDTTIRSPEDAGIQLQGLEDIAWKTGTSNGFRDAWTIAVTDKYTIGVWIGNMNGQPGRALIGGKIAAPLALQLAQSLKRGSSSQFVYNSGMERAPVCIASGLAPGPHCTSLSTGRFLQNPRDSRKCNIHKAVLVDAESHYELCARCQDGHNYATRSVAQYPSDVAYWLRSNNHSWADAIGPQHNPACAAARSGEPPVIITPQDGSEIIRLADLPADFQKIGLTARTSDPAATLHWFLNDTIIGRAKPHDTVRIAPQPGRHTVKCVDDRGRASQVTFTVEDSADLEKRNSYSHLSDSNAHPGASPSQLD